MRIPYILPSGGAYSKLKRTELNVFESNSLNLMLQNFTRRAFMSVFRVLDDVAFNVQRRMALIETPTSLK
jgi:hypothetical protein